MQEPIPSTTPVQPVRPIGWREKYAASLVILIGLFFLLMQIFALLSSKEEAFSQAEGAFVVKKGALFTEIRTWVTIVLALTGGILLWKGKRPGWVLGMALLFFFIALALYGVVTFAMDNTFDNTFKLVAGLAGLLFIGILFLALPSARKKYRVGKRTYLPTLLIFMAIAAVYFFLQ